MKQLVVFLILASLHVIVTNAEPNLVCYYNSASVLREGEAKFSNSDLELALQFCTHLVYGYAGIDREWQVHSLNKDLDIKKHQFTEVTSLRRRYPHLKVLLSVGGDRDIDESHPDKYIELLEGGKRPQAQFIESAYSFVKHYGFDGLDLAYQFPRNKPRKVHSSFGSFIKSIKKLVTGDFIVDPNAAQHKEQFTALVQDTKKVLDRDNFLLSLTVLPNVNSTWYFDIPALKSVVDFVNLAAFDFLTPERNPEEADYTAPLLSPEEDQDRLSHYNAKFQAEYWLKQGFPSTKINMGVASYGNAWKLNSDSSKTGTPVVSDTDGPAPEGPHSKKAGLLSYPEICVKLKNPEYTFVRGNQSARSQTSFGSYSFRAAKGSNSDGIWISYDDLDTVSYKAIYSQAKLGGIALFDLAYDDFRGVCGDIYPILRTIKYRFSTNDHKIRKVH